MNVLIKSFHTLVTAQVNQLAEEWINSGANSPVFKALLKKYLWWIEHIDLDDLNPPPAPDFELEEIKPTVIHEDLYITKEEVVEYYQISAATLARESKMPGFPKRKRIGGRNRWLKEDLDKWWATNPSHPVQEAPLTREVVRELLQQQNGKPITHKGIARRLGLRPAQVRGILGKMYDTVKKVGNKGWVTNP